MTVAGKIENPGKIDIPLEGTLSDVINMTGPRKPLSGKIFLIRYNSDGTLMRRNIKYQENSAPGSSRNPYLMAGDLISIKDSLAGRTSNTLRQITDPFVGIFTTKKTFESFTE